MRRVFVICLALGAIAVSAFAERTVKIESAKTSEYVQLDNGPVKDSEGDGIEQKKSEIVRFRGNVSITVTDGNSVSKISADEITYDKTRDMLEALGNVVYVHTTGKSGAERFTGNSLLFNIKKQEGVFLDGVVTQDTGSSDSDPYIIHSTVSGRNAGSTMAFKDGVLTTCDAEDPHWSINASRIWLLPGNEIALLNGLFYVGPLPVFYLPFFYYPADEMIVHPVFGYRSREGYFVQTTTYLIGRKPLAAKEGEKNTFANFLQSGTLKEQKQNGLFLTNLETDAKSTNGNYFKLMFDSYSVLGTMAGFDGSFSTDTLLKSVTLSSMFGFSKTMYPRKAGPEYSTYDAGGKENWNSSWIFGKKFPFRNRTNLSLQLDKSPVQFSLTMPFVSDMMFKEDFLDRSENLNWFTLLIPSMKDTDTTVATETSYAWTANGSITPDLSFASPWIKTASLSSVSGSLSFNSKTNTLLSGDDLTYAPDRIFFYPEMIKPDGKLSFGGTLFTTEFRGNTKKTQSGNKDRVSTGDLNNPFKEPEAKRTSGDTEVSKDKPASEEAKKNNAEFFPPAGISYAAETDGRKKSVFSLNWMASPAWAQELRYNSAKWNTPSDIDWNDFSSNYYQFRTTANLAGNYTFDTDFLSATSSLDLTGTYQNHPLLTGASYTTEAQKDVVRLADFKANTYKLGTTDTVKLSPFNRNDLFRPVSFSWSMTGSLLKNVFSGTVSDPSWKLKTIEWTDDYIDVHNTSFVAGVRVWDLAQTFTLTNNLPPLQESWAETASFNYGIGTLTMGSKYYDKNPDKNIKEMVWDPFTETISLKLPFGITLGQEYAWNIEKKEHSKLGFTGSWGWITGYYTISSTVPYVLKSGTGWILDGADPRFVPTTAGLTVSNGSTPFTLAIWKNRLTVASTLSSNLKFNLLKLTDSSLIFTPTLTFRIYDFVDISFSTNSSNDVIARYMQGLLHLPEPLPGESNPVVDLAKSFNFFNTKDRFASGFKLKKLDLAVVHYLHDWTANFKTSLAPKLKSSGGQFYYEFTPSITFIVQWKPITDIKTKVRSKEGVFTLDTASNATKATGNDSD
jgi:lipopolysaccharide assembly outer membrane protein LptD (OstA)